VRAGGLNDLPDESRTRILQWLAPGSLTKVSGQNYRDWGAFMKKAKKTQVKHTCDLCGLVRASCKGERWSGIVACRKCRAEGEAEAPDADAEWYDLDEDGCMDFGTMLKPLNGDEESA